MVQPKRGYRAASWRMLPAYMVQPIDHFLMDGVKPTVPDLLALLHGNRPLAAHLYTGHGPFDEVVAFVEKFIPDIAWGNPAYVRRWHQEGGLNGLNHKAKLQA